MSASFGNRKVSKEPQKPRKSSITSKSKPKKMGGFVIKGRWKKRPLPAHSGVPVPRKMKLICEELFFLLDSEKLSKEPQKPRKSSITSTSTPKKVGGFVMKGRWKKRPLPAHSGVPVPEKMKLIRELFLLDSDSEWERI